MLVLFEKVALGHGERTKDTIPKLDSGIAAVIIGTNKFSTMLDIFGDYKIGSLLIQTKRKKEMVSKLEMETGPHKDSELNRTLAL